MDRVKYLLLAGTLALMVLAVGAGPSAAARGGYSDNAHACQQGGHVNLAHPSTGLAFENAGDCASHGAKGNVYSSLQVLTNTYPCPDGTCWGTVSGSGLMGESDWLVFILESGDLLGSGITDATGSVSEKLVLPCGGGLSGVLAHSTTSAGARINSAEVNSPCG
jgi:hypothetical protein